MERSIVTKKGDRGYTYPYSGGKLSKDDLRLEVVGTMDELSSFLGMAKSLIIDKSGKNILERIQKDLFILGTQISGLGSKKSKRRIASKNIQYLEQRIKELEKIFPFKKFCVPRRQFGFFNIACCPYCCQTAGTQSSSIKK